MTGNWQETFGGQVVKPAQVQFEELNITGDTQLYWPTESLPGVPYVAAQINVTSTVDGQALIMPDARNGATGVASMICNVGAHTVAIQDATTGAILTIAAGVSWIVTLTDNTTEAGAWQTQQLGATTSSADAAALAGAGLQAAAGKLRSYIPTTPLNSNTTLNQTYRCNAVIWTGGAGTLQLDTIANLVVGWWCLVVNEGSGALTISTSGGATINGEASLVIPANPASGGQYYSAMIVCAAGGFNVFNMVPNPTPIVGGGTGADNAGDALINLGGSAIGIDIFEAPTAAAIRALIGLGAGAFTEASVSGNQTLTPDQANTAYVCTAALVLNLPNTSAVTNQFVIAAYAQGGAVTLHPGALDKINGGVAGANFVMPQGSSVILVTDAANPGNWWPLAYYPTLDSYGSAQGDILYRDAASWAALAPGTINFLLKTGGAGANPAWASISTILDTISSTRGVTLYRGASGWAALAVGTSGQFLQTQGAGADPQWANVGGSLIQIDAYSTAGVYTWTRPTGTALIVGEVAGAGASGGSAGVTSDGHGMASSGGGAGAWTKGQISSPASSYTVTVGAGGSAPAAGPNNGSDGAASSIGGVMVSGGGSAGQAGTDFATRTTQNKFGGAGGTVSTPGNILSFTGSVGNPGVGGIDSGVCWLIGGNGGVGPYGGLGVGGSYAAVNTDGATVGIIGRGPGSGGGGAAAYRATGSTSAAAGAGAPGFVSIASYR